MKLFEFLTDDFAGANSYMDREHYYLQFLESSELSFYSNLISSNSVEKNFFSTTQKVKLFEIEFNAGIEIITKNLGAPRFKTSYHKDGFHITVLFFKKQFYSYTAILQFHLINNSFVFGSIIIPEHNKKINKVLNKLLSIKYNEQITAMPSDEDYTIHDEKNNKVQFRNYFFPSVLYVGNNIEMITSAVKTSNEKNIYLNQKHSSEWYNHL